MKSKQLNSNQVISQILAGKKRLEDVLSRYKFIFTPDPKDEAVMTPEDYTKKYAPRKVEVVKKNKKAAAEVESFPNDGSPQPDRSNGRRIYLSQGHACIDFSTSSGDWSQIRNMAHRAISGYTVV